MTEFADVKSTFDYLKKNAKEEKTAKAPSGSEIPVSGTPIDLLPLFKMSEEAGEPGEVERYDFLEADVFQKIMDQLYDEKTLTQAMLNQNPPIKIAYTDEDGFKTLHEIIPSGIDGYIVFDEDDDDVPKNYSYIYLDSICLTCRDENSFRATRISAAWFQGQEINLGNYLADLCRKTKHYKDAVAKRK